MKTATATAAGNAGLSRIASCREDCPTNKQSYPPGPWVRAVAVHSETGLTHAAIFTKKSLADHGAHFPLMVFDHQGTPSDGVANLLSAAPDLLDALRPLLDFAAEANEGMPEGGRLSADIKRARLAIAKAAGQSGTAAKEPESEPLSGMV